MGLIFSSHSSSGRGKLQHQSKDCGRATASLTERLWAAEANGSQLGYQNSICLLRPLRRRLHAFICPSEFPPCSPPFRQTTEEFVRRTSSCQHAPHTAKPRTLRPPDPYIDKEAKESGEEHGARQLALDALERQEDFRLSYLRKLSYAQAWVPAAQRPPKHQTVIIWDWDDTLLCTRFLGQYEGTRLPEDVKAQLRLIEDASKRLLERSLELGHTFIITNAMEWWVKDSAARWIPSLLPVLEKIRIISARSRYDKSGAIPRDVGQWKISTFKDLQKEFDLPGVTNLIAIGDSDYEINAARIMGRDFAEATVKTMKFREDPSAEELSKELALIEDKLDYLVGAACDLTLNLKRSVR